jgi:hypothetical protein
MFHPILDNLEKSENVWDPPVSGPVRMTAPTSRPRHRLLTTLNGQRQVWWCEGWPDLRWRAIGKSIGQHSLWMQVRLLDTDPPGTQPHLNGVGPGVEVGGPQTLGCRGVGGATPTTTATIAIVAVILLFIGLLRLLFLRLLLLLLMSWRVFLPAGGARR